CFVARGLNPEVWKRAEEQKGEHGAKLYCLGKCYIGPATADDTRLPRMEGHSREPVVMERVIKGGARSLAGDWEDGGDAAVGRGGWRRWGAGGRKRRWRRLRGRICGGAAGRDFRRGGSGGRWRSSRRG